MAAVLNDNDKPASGSDKDALVKEAKSYLELCIKIDGGNRDEGLDDLRKLAGDHWDDKDKRQRQLDRRPCFVINKLPTFLHQVTNDQRQNVPSIKVSPVDSNADVETAEVIQGWIRHTEYSSNADVAYDTAVNSAAAIGFGYFRLITDYCTPTSFDQDIKFRRIRNPFTVYLDPMSEEPDGSDQKRCMITSKMARQDFKREYPDAEASNEGFPLGMGDSSNSNWLGDDFVRIAEYYRIEKTAATAVQLSNGETGWKDALVSMPPGVTIKAERPSFRAKVMLYKITALDILESTEIKCEWIPVFPVYGDEIDLDGEVIRSGILRNAKDPQFMYDYWMHQALDTPVATAQGWSTIGALSIGDTVFADDGQPTSIIGKSPVYIGKDCYEVQFDDGEKVVSSAEHPWVVEVRGKRQSSGFSWTTAKLRTDELDPKQHVIKVCAALDLPTAQLPVDPYMLGLWLGDGTSRSGAITAGDRDVDAIMQNLTERGLNVGFKRVYVGKSAQFTVHGVVGDLKALGVFGDKHIPSTYLRASIDQRTELLRGLMDSDGSISGRNYQCCYTGTNARLVGNVRELLHSLGMKTTVTSRAGRVSKMANGQDIVSSDHQQIMFSAPSDVAIFGLDRKRALQLAPRARCDRRRLQRKIVSVERVASVPVQCIAIDAPSHLYLCGRSMIPTHNTCATEEVAMRTRTPVVGAEGQFEGYEDDWESANTRNIPFLEYKMTALDGQLAPPPQRQMMIDVPQGVLTMAMHANDNIKATTGLFDSSLGAMGNARSGLQERSQQRQGDMANFHFTDNLNRTVRHVGRCLISMMPHYLDAPRLIRVMGEDDTIKPAQINQPGTKTVPQSQAPAGSDPQPVTGPNGQPQTDPETGEMLVAIQTILNDMTVGEYDVTVSAGPSYSTLRQEAAASMVQFGKSWPKLMDIAGDKVVKAMDWPGATEIAERIAKTIPPEIRGTDDGQPPQPVVNTPKGPIPVDQAAQMLQEMDQHIQQLSGALESAQSGLDKARIDAESREKVAQINADAKSDVAELTGLVQLLIARIPPPPSLGDAVAADLAYRPAPDDPSAANGAMGQSPALPGNGVA